MYSYSAPLRSAINAVLDTPSTANFTLNFNLINDVDPSYSFTPIVVDSMTINQNFAEKFCDIVYLNCRMHISDYQNLMQHLQGLMAIITIVYVDVRTGRKVYDPVPIVRRYIASLRNPEDKYISNPAGSVTQTNSRDPQLDGQLSNYMEVRFQLIDELAYRLRQQHMQVMFENTTVESALYYITKTFEIPTAHIVEPDNTHVYGNIKIPPGMTFDTIFIYLQEKYGIYMKGLDFYVQDGILYIYPAYENQSTFPYTCTILNAGANAFTGMQSYHKWNGNDLSFITMTDVSSRNVSNHAAEQHGTSMSFTRASRVMDDGIVVTDEGAYIIDNNTVSVSLSANSKSIRTNANVDRYQRATDNIFKLQSELAKNHTGLVSLGWQQAVPFSFYPGHAINYCYDYSDSFRSAPGLLEVVEYEIQLMQRLENGNVYGCRANMRIRVDADVI